NAARAWDEPRGKNGRREQRREYLHTPFFEDLEKSLVNAYRTKHPKKEVQTLYRKNAAQYPQNDHLFISQDLEPPLERGCCDVMSYDKIRCLSDHVPLIMSLVS